MASGLRLLPFQRAIVDQLIGADGLALVARGLGLRSLVCAVLRVYNVPDNLVLVVNATQDEERGLNEELGMALKTIGHEQPANER
jgi:DNA excision repair protein ERCC-4